MNETWLHIVVSAVKVLVAAGSALGAVPLLVLAERKIVGYMQQRPGPNRVGPWGVLQTFVDGLKLFFKEDLAPRGVERILFILSPAVIVMTALMTFSALPLGPEVELWGYRTRLAVADLDSGVLYVLAIGSLGVYGLILGGWSSNNKYSLMGSLRSSAQIVSYELPLGLGLAGVLILAGTFHLGTIAEQQGHEFWNWYVWRQPLGFLLVLVAGVAETNRLPFDLPEGESELTGGFHTEYSSMKFAFFFMAEYVNMIIFSVLTTTLFLGGWHAPIPALGPEGILSGWVGETFGSNGLAIWTIVNAAVWLTVKVAAFIFFYILLRGTLPRLRYDQLMSLGWKIMIPAAFANLALTAIIVVAADGAVRTWALFVAGFGVIILADFAITARRRKLRYDLRVS